MTAMEPNPEEEAAISLAQEFHIEEDKEGENYSSNSTTESIETESLPSLEEVEELLNYRFSNKSLLEEAFTHASFPGTCISYERLEYIGDSVLSLLFAKEQYFLYPELPPGSLTRLRAVNVDTEKLARVALNHGLHRYLRHNKPLLEEQIREFRKKIMDFPLHSNGLVNAPKALADIVESSIGAVFIDSNSSLDTVWKVFKSLLEPIISPKTIGKHPMSELYELCQKKGWKLEFVTDLPNRLVDVFVEDHLIGRAPYDLKKKKIVAHNRAAKDALSKIERVLGQLNITNNH